MEYLQIFDNKKRPINEKIERRFKRSLKNGKRYMVTLIFIKNSKDEFLVQLTSKQKKNVYAITGGHVTYGDDSIKTAIKETKEEVGINLSKEELNYVGTTIEEKCFCDIYYVNKDIPIDNMNLQYDEVESVYWLTLKQIKNLIDNHKFREYNIQPLKKLLESI